MLYLVEDGQTVVSKIQRLKGQTVITGIWNKRKNVLTKKARLPGMIDNKTCWELS